MTGKAFRLELGRRCRAARLRAGLSQADAGDRLGTRGAHVCHLERGRTGVSVERLCRIARAYGVPVVDLIPEVSPR